MKKYIAALMAVALILTISIPKQEAKAEAITMAVAAGAVIAIGVTSGLVINASQASGQSVQSYVSGKINKYLNGTSVTEWLGEGGVTSVGNKLIIGSLAYAAIKSFLNSFIQDNDITSTPKTVTTGELFGYDIYPYSYQNYPYPLLQKVTDGNSYDTTVAQEGFSVVLDTSGATKNVRAYMNGTQIGYNSLSKTYNTGWIFVRANNDETGCKLILRESTGIDSNGTLTGGSAVVSINIKSMYLTGTNSFTLALSTNSWDDQNIDTGYQWEGTVTGASDTNIEDLVGDIFTDTANNDLIIDDDVVVESPQVTPQPTNPPVSDIPGQLDGIQEGLNDLIGTQTGIAGTAEGIQEGVGSIAETAEGIAEGIENISEALEIPTTSEAVNLKLPDLRTLFPFCIPFDIYNIITAFNASPVAPHVQIPFNIPAIGLTYTFDLDFSSFNNVASVLRTVEFVAYAIGLAILTSKVIRW